MLSKSMDARTGRPSLSAHTVHMDALHSRETQLSEVRLRHIGLKMALATLEQARRSRDMIGFELVLQIQELL